MTSSIIMTPTFISSLLRIPSLPRNNWYHIAAVTLSILNRPEEISLVYKYAINDERCTIPGSDTAEYVAEERQWLARGGGEGKERIGRIERIKSDGNGGKSGSGEEKRESALRVVRRMREALVKSAAVGGLPKAINSLLALKRSHAYHLLDPTPDPSQPSLHNVASTHPTSRLKSLPPSFAASLSPASPASPSSSSSSPSPSSPSAPSFDPFPSQITNTTTSQILSRGNNFWERVYGPVGPRIMSSMSSTSPDLGVVAKWMYGLVLSEESVLDGRETGFLMVAALVPQDTNPQLKGHLKGAVNNGASKEEVNAVRDFVMKICQESGMKWRSEVSRL